ncbi:uncharacterized protein BYT42DRAFT_566193 [Radiomyces spectabilis]|uniref:uncharacterized protein n=1 Tax=Radiomyces spectabilis TaxID=64574 RepID=UPI0022209AAD|nr:uncharacterized protein BYT42DRAFT_566193 [Radiomyces spectabilis]KAI8381343.1 hypothetical protein BYT42DRAFT_566193 [Radiomyces spectabilis]
MTVFFVISAVFLCLYITVVAQESGVSDAAKSLGLKVTWTAPMPSTAMDDAKAFISEQWSLPYKHFYGDTNLAFTEDTISSNSSSSSTVLRILYGQGSYSPSATRSSNVALGGTDFYTQPLQNQSFASALLSYEVAFASNFDWVLGGKLPGIFGGTPGVGCSGGQQSDDNQCFSMRLMWREAGNGEAYGYIPRASEYCRKHPLTQCHDDYGVSFSRGMIQLQKNQWTKLEIFVQINDPPSESNGILKVWQDGNLVIYQNDVVFRTSNALAVSSLMFSTFFGGGTTKYATPSDTYAYFKNIQYSVGAPVVLTNSVSFVSTSFLVYIIPYLVFLFLQCL